MAVNHVTVGESSRGSKLPGSSLWHDSCLILCQGVSSPPEPDRQTCINHQILCGINNVNLLLLLLKPTLANLFLKLDDITPTDVQ